MQFTKKEIKLYNSLLYVKADTKRLKLIEYNKGKKKILLNKEREVRKTNAGGMAKKKYRRHYGALIKNTKKWHQSQFSKAKLKANYERIKFDILKKEQLKYFKDWLKKRNLDRKWYEKFKWFKFKNILCVGGKNKESNEELIKRYAQKDELVFHTEAPGSPFFLIKSNNPDEQLIKKTATATAYFSKDWKQNKRDVKVMYCKAQQLKKQSNLPLGTFKVNGLRQIINIKATEIKNFKL